MSSKKIILQSLILVILTLLFTGCEKAESHNQILQDISELNATTYELNERVNEPNIELDFRLSELEIQIGELQKHINEINNREPLQKNTVENNLNELDIEKIFEMICDPKTKEDLTSKVESSESNVEGGQQMLFLINLICG